MAFKKYMPSSITAVEECDASKAQLLFLSWAHKNHAKIFLSKNALRNLPLGSYCLASFLKSSSFS